MRIRKKMSSKLMFETVPQEAGNCPIGSALKMRPRTTETFWNTLPHWITTQRRFLTICYSKPISGPGLTKRLLSEFDLSIGYINYGTTLESQKGQIHLLQVLNLEDIVLSNKIVSITTNRCDTSERTYKFVFESELHATNAHKKIKNERSKTFKNYLIIKGIKAKAEEVELGKELLALEEELLKKNCKLEGTNYSPFLPKKKNKNTKKPPNPKVFFLFNIKKI
jgi:hypothetical protein